MMQQFLRTSMIIIIKGAVHQKQQIQLVFHNQQMFSSTYRILILFFTFLFANSTTVVVNGGQVTISGAVTNTQIDLFVNYTANVQWLAIIFSKDEVNTDLHLLIKDTGDAARPVKVKDCYLDENSKIVYDDVNNIMPSVTNFWGDVSYGMKIAYNRDLNTNDLQDKRFYINDVIQVCFMSSLTPFIGGGYEQGNQKICSFLSLHNQVDYYQDRLLGNFAATSLLGGSNLTIYATQSTDQGSFQSWLFLGLVHKQQGLTPFSGKWIGVTYLDQMSETDVTISQFGYRNFLYKVNIMDMYITNNSYAKSDLQYPDRQGGNDIYQTLGGAVTNQYMVAVYKRKFMTGDNNRDTNVSAGSNYFCFYLGNAWAYNTFSYSQRICLNITVTTSYYSNFRVDESTSGTEVIDFVQPPNTVIVVVWQKFILMGTFLILLIIWL